jgi:aminopeptidase N
VTPQADDNLLRSEAARRSELISNVEYEVRLDLTGDEHTFGSEARVSFDGGGGADPAELFLDLIADEVESVEVDGQALTLSDVVDGTRIRLSGLSGGTSDRHEVRVVAHCRYEHTSKGLHRFVDPVDQKVYLHTQFEPFEAHRVYACFDQPDLKAPFRLTVLAPSEWEAISNEPLSSREEEGPNTRWSFEPTPRISPYLTALVAGPFHSAFEDHKVASSGQEIRLGVYCRQSLAEHLDFDDVFLVTRQGFDFFTAEYDYPYPFTKYDQLFVPEFFAGAMENTGCVTFSESMVFRGKVTELQREYRAEVILHEMAHMWFGDLVTMKWWDDLWLKESFATYMSYLAAAEGTRFTDAWARFASGTKAGAYAQDQLPSTHPISADIIDTEALKQHFDGITYNKGASVLRQLAAWVGRNGFRAGVQSYCRTHEWANAELADLLGALEKPSGRDLSSWSKEWLETAGVNTLRATYEENDGTYGPVRIGQTAIDSQPTLRSHRIGLGLFNLRDGKLERTEELEIDVVGAVTEVSELTGKPVADLLLLNDRDLAYAKIRFDSRSIATLTEHLSSIEDQLARSLCWGAAWDMVRDAELPTGQWVKIVSRHAADEPDLSTALEVVGRAAAAANAYGDPTRRREYRAALAGVARTRLDASDGGSDAQTSWAGMWLNLIDEPSDLAIARGWLGGEAVPEGLDIDVNIRWSVVSRLAASGADDGVELIEAENKRDATDIGARRALAAKAARPDAAAKEEAWGIAVDNQEIPLVSVRAFLWQGFHQASQEDVLVPFVDRYPEAFDKIWAERDHDVATSLSAMLFPSSVIDEGTIAMADGLLARDDISPAARRSLREAKDGMQRALRARKADAGT